MGKVNWHAASSKCGALGGELMVLDDYEDYLKTTMFLKSQGLLASEDWKNSLWAGIHRLGNGVDFRKSKNGEDPFLPWVPGEPNNGNPEEACVAFGNYLKTNGYIDFQCTSENPYVCQHPKIRENYLCIKREYFVETIF
ncbi:uncharacterized protein Dana_GF19678 [Drosophila ananassae]|uniref:C-type lectin domain-containing protein n=1 Tax=Drosophila ananassae TaxID=7217 RepID=B3MK15_DROAN|nr:C-type lectin 37Db [Drosophila ananassae]EDV31433.2 uncharacterized protein Dana_GF19678 [Drosophila ananassae]